MRCARAPPLTACLERVEAQIAIPGRTARTNVHLLDEEAREAFDRQPAGHEMALAQPRWAAMAHDRARASGASRRRRRDDSDTRTGTSVRADRETQRSCTERFACANQCRLAAARPSPRPRPRDRPSPSRAPNDQES